MLANGCHDRKEKETDGSTDSSANVWHGMAFSFCSCSLLGEFDDSLCGKDSLADILLSSFMNLTNLGDERTTKLSSITEQLEETYAA